MNRTQLRLILLIAFAVFFATVLVLLMRPRDSQQRTETKPKQEAQQTQASPPQDTQPTDQQVRTESQEEQKPQPVQPTQPPPAQVHVRVEETPTPTPSENMHARVIADIQALSARLQEYNTRNNAYPTTGQGLRALGNIPKDPWQHDYIFESPSTRNRESYDLFSAGPDGIPDTPDDDWGDESESGDQ